MSRAGSRALTPISMWGSLRHPKFLLCQQVYRHDLQRGGFYLLVLWMVVPPRTMRTPGLERFRLNTARASSYVAPPMRNTIMS